MNLLLFVASISFAALASPEQGQKVKSFDLSKQKSNVAFKVVGKSSPISFDGTSSKLNGKIKIDGTNAEGEFIVPLDSIQTGIALRDEHIKNYLETQKFPNAILKISKFHFKNNLLHEKGAQNSIPFKGVLLLHGHEAEVSGSVDIDSTDEVISIVANTKTNIANYKMETGTKIVDEIDIRVNFNIKKN